MLGSLQSGLSGSRLLRLLLHLLLQISAASTCLSAEIRRWNCNGRPHLSPLSLPLLPLQDHPTLVKRTTRLQQPLQYEREYIAETRCTGEQCVAGAIDHQLPGLRLGCLLATALPGGHGMPPKWAGTAPWVLLCTSYHTWELASALRPPCLTPPFQDSGATLSFPNLSQFHVGRLPLMLWPPGLWHFC